MRKENKMKEEKQMTNLEHVASKDLIGICNQLCDVAHVCKYGSSCLGKDCFKCEFDDNINLCVKTLLEEHKEYREYIQLTGFEFDLLKSVIKAYGNQRFSWNKGLCDMKDKGYFENVIDETMTIQEILDSCEVLADDYVVFEWE